MSDLTHPSPNFDARRGDIEPSVIILHYTGMKSAAEAIVRLMDPASKVSAHYTVDEDGKVYSHVEEGMRAWHAGQSFWRGLGDINSHSIGIEIVNPGHEFGYQRFPEKQIRAVSELCLDILKRFDLPPESVLGHSDIAPARKEDPGELFPWKMLAEQGVGIWPSPSDEDMVRGAGIDTDRALIDAGYDPKASPHQRLLAFQRHFEPEAFGEGDEGNISGRTRARLYAWLAGHWLIPRGQS